MSRLVRTQEPPFFCQTAAKSCPFKQASPLLPPKDNGSTQMLYKMPRIQMRIINTFKWAQSHRVNTPHLCAISEPLTSGERELNFFFFLFCPASLSSLQTLGRKALTASGLSEQPRERRRDSKRLDNTPTARTESALIGRQHQGYFLCEWPKPADASVVPRPCYPQKTANEMGERGRVRSGGEDLVAVRVTGVRTGSCQERLTAKHWHHCCAQGVIFFPQCSRAPGERAVEGSEVLAGLCRNTRH